MVEKKSDGIVVRGAKINISGAFVAHELVVLPQSAKRKGEEDYALSFAIPTDTEGITYICQNFPLQKERWLMISMSWESAIRSERNLDGGF